jgi:hypothetical protein
VAAAQDILGDQWSPALTTCKVMLSLLSYLVHPDPKPCLPAQGCSPENYLQMQTQGLRLDRSLLFHTDPAFYHAVARAHAVKVG